MNDPTLKFAVVLAALVIAWAALPEFIADMIIRVDIALAERAREPEPMWAAHGEQLTEEEIERAEELLAISDRQQKFEEWALDNLDITNIWFAAEGDGTFFVRLEPQLYTNTDDVRVLAENIARYYVLQSGLSGAVCHVDLGDVEYAKGSYRP